MELGCKEYFAKLMSCVEERDWGDLEEAADVIFSAWEREKNIFLCGNGGSAGNAIHLANDFLYGAGAVDKKGLRVEALSANPSVITCLANDVGYDEIYSAQIDVKGSKDDVLIVLSGSGNAPNILKAVQVAHSLSMSTIAILGFSGGACLEQVKLPIHFCVDDMQIAEDLQLIAGHIIMQKFAAG
jgi:D-sedoheptulose 7-phosphate isomerase